MPRTSSATSKTAGRRAGACVVDSEPARAALLAVAGARPCDPWLLHAQAPGAGDRGHRRRARHEPLDDAPLRDHARRARLSRAGRLAQVPPRAARHRPRDVRAELHRAARARPPVPGGAAPAHLLHHQPRRARRRPTCSTWTVCAASAAARARSTWICTRARGCPRTAPSIGKLLLANLPEAEQRELIAEMKLTKRGPNTITARKRCATSSTRSTRRASPSTTRSSPPSLYAIAAPVRNEAREVVAAVNLAAPSSVISLEELVDALGPHLVSTADRISARLGYRRDDETN